MKRHGFPNPWRGGGCGRTMKRFDDPAAPQKDKTFLVAHVIAALDDSMRKTMEPLQPQYLPDGCVSAIRPYALFDRKNVRILSSKRVRTFPFAGVLAGQVIMTARFSAAFYGLAVDDCGGARFTPHVFAQIQMQSFPVRTLQSIPLKIAEWR